MQQEEQETVQIQEFARRVGFVATGGSEDCGLDGTTTLNLPAVGDKAEVALAQGSSNMIRLYI